jgi:S1-C subfamily serine protease
MKTFDHCLLMLLVLVGLSGSAPAQVRTPSWQESMREVNKYMRDYVRGWRKVDKDGSRYAYRFFRPGSKFLPQGTGQQPGEFRLEGLKMGDLGVAFANEGPGLVVEQIYSGGPLAEAGLRERDRILAVGDHRVENERDLVKYLFADNRRSGKVGLSVLHSDDRVEIIDVEPSVLLEKIVPKGNDDLAALGITLGDRAGNELRVEEIVPQSSAEKAGLRHGDVLHKFDGALVRSPKDLSDLLKRAEPGPHSIEVMRDQSRPTLTIKLR